MTGCWELSWSWRYLVLGVDVEKSAVRLYPLPFLRVSVYRDRD